MKKVLTTALALGLVAGVANASDLSMTGSYSVEGYTINNVVGTTSFTNVSKVGGGAGSAAVNSNAAGEGNGVTRSWIEQTVKIKPTWKVADNLKVFAELRLADSSVFGEQPDAEVADERVVDLRKIYFDWTNTPVAGTVRMGMVPVGARWTAFNDNGTQGSRIQLIDIGGKGALGPLSLGAFVEYKEAGLLGGAVETTDVGDSDDQYYEVNGKFTADMVTVGAYVGARKNKTAKIAAGTGTETDGINYGLYAKATINNNLFIEAEMNAFDQSVESQVVGNVDDDQQAMAAMIQAGYKMDALSMNLMYFYAEGDKNCAAATNDTTANKCDAYMRATDGVGDDFNPLQILTGDNMGLLNGDATNGAATSVEKAGVHAIVLGTDFTVSDKLSVNGALGWAQADDEDAGWDDAYGWEIDLGMKYKLTPELTYSANFGYLDTGDFFKTDYAGITTEDVWTANHSINFAF